MSKTYEALSAKPSAPPVAARNANVPATIEDTAANLLAASAGPAPILKFKKGKFFVGETEVPLGREFLAYCSDWQQGFVKFVDGTIVDRRVGRIADRFRSPDRDELDDNDESKWPAGIDGKPADPWVFQNYVPMEARESGDLFLFVTGSAGGAMAVRALCNKYARNIHKGTPTIELAVATFTSKKYGPTQRPDFPIVAWENDTGAVDVTPPMSVEMDDAIPF